MTSTEHQHDVEVRRRIAAAPGMVYDLVSDVTRMGEWSPETASCRWVGDVAAARGRRPVPRHQPPRTADLDDHLHGHRGGPGTSVRVRGLLGRCPDLRLGLHVHPGRRRLRGRRGVERPASGIHPGGVDARDGRRRPRRAQPARHGGHARRAPAGGRVALTQPDALGARPTPDQLHRDPEAAMHRRTVLVGVVAAAVAGLGAAQLPPGGAPAARADGLTGYASCDELLAHYRAELERTVDGVRVRVRRAARVDDTCDRLGAPGPRPASAAEPERGRQRPDRHQPAGAGRRRAGPGQAARRPPGRPHRQPARIARARAPARGCSARCASATARRTAASCCSSATAPSSWSPAGALDPSAAEQLRRTRDGSRSTCRARPPPRSSSSTCLDDQPRLIERSVYDAQYVSARLVDGTVRLVTTTRPQPPVYYPTGPARCGAQSLVANQRAAGERDARRGPAAGGPQRRRRHGARAGRRGVLRPDRSTPARRPARAPCSSPRCARPTASPRPTSTAVTTDGDLVYASAGPALRRHQPLGHRRPGAADADVRVGSEYGRRPTRSAPSCTPSTPPRLRRPVRRHRHRPGLRAGPLGAVQHEGALRVATTRQPPWRRATRPARRPRCSSSSSSATVRWSRPAGSAGSARPSRSGRCATSATSRRS